MKITKNPIESNSHNMEKGEKKTDCQRSVLVAINARYSHTNLAVRLLRQSCIEKEHEYELVIAEYTINDHPRSLLQKLNELNGKVYAFSCYIWNREIVDQLCRELKQIKPDCFIIAGGPEASWQPECFLRQNSAVDLVISGEGENVLPELLNYLTNGPGVSEAFANHNNITYRDSEGVIKNSFSGNQLSAENWPFAYNTVELENLSDRILYYESSRGCPFGCTYCLSAIEKKVRFRPLDLVWHELEILIETDVRLVKFVDRTFNCNASRARQIWRWLLDRYNQKKFRTKFHFEITAELLEDDCILLLNQVPQGLFQFEIGVQSTQPDVLKLVNRPCRTGLLIHRVGQLKAAGNIHIHLDLIAGLPGETFNMFRSSFNDVASMHPDMLQLGFLKVLPGSLMQIQAAERLMSWQSRPPYEVLCSDAMSFNELSALKRIENIVDIFYNSGQFKLGLDYLFDDENSLFDFYLEMAGLYKAKGWENRQIGRHDKWKFLLDFCNEKRTAKNSEILRDLLVLDYIYTGQKDRPDWQNALEYSSETDDRVLVKKAKEIIRDGFPDCKRFRVEKFSLNPSVFFENCASEIIRIRESETVADLNSRIGWNDWLAVFDFSGSLPLLIWQEQILKY